MKTIFILTLLFFFSCEEKIDLIDFDFTKDSLNTVILGLRNELNQRDEKIQSLNTKIEDLNILISELQSNLAKSFPINLQNRSPLYFSSNEFCDTLLVSIAGNNWNEALYTIEIKQRTGETRYFFQQKFRSMVSGFDYSSKEFLVNVSHNYLKPDSQKYAKSLPMPFIESESEKLEIDDDEYNDIIHQNVPIFRHQTYFEGWKVLYYNREQDKARVILSGGY